MKYSPWSFMLPAALSAVFIANKFFGVEALSSPMLVNAVFAMMTSYILVTMNARVAMPVLPRLPISFVVVFYGVAYAIAIYMATIEKTTLSVDRINSLGWSVGAAIIVALVHAFLMWRETKRPPLRRKGL